MPAKKKRAAPKSPLPVSPEPRTQQLPPFSFRADVATVNDEARTAELVFSTGAAVERFDWMLGKRYLEVLSLEEGAVRTARLDSGGPLLDSHSAWSVMSQIGAVVPGTVEIKSKEARATVRFSKREDVQPIWQDVRDGIIRSVSVGYRVYKFEEEDGDGKKMPVRTAVDWEPFEISMVPIPADAGARVREAEADSNPCVIVTRSVEANMAKKKNDTPETIADVDPFAEEVEETRADDPPEPNERQLGIEAERKRCAAIQAAVTNARCPHHWIKKMIEDGTSIEDAQQRCLDEVAKRNGDAPNGTPRVEMDVDPFLHVREGVENALLNRLAPDYFKLEDKGRRYRGMTLFDVAKAFLGHVGIRTTDLTKTEIAGAALGLSVRAGMHTTSDFANLLADLPGKILRMAYQEAPQTFAPITRRTTLPDFKPSRLLQLGEAPALLQVGEHGEFTEGTMGESKEQYQLATWGRKFSITRQALLNDDTDAFSRVPMAFGRQAANKESDLVWAEINNNAALGDGIALFHASHGNLAGSGGAIDVTTLGAGRAAMRAQKGIDGATKLNINPVYLMVPVAIETVADQFVTVITPQQGSNANPFSGRLTVIAEPRLDDTSATAWYLAASTMQIDIIVLGGLEGEPGPTVESRVGFDVDGIEIKVRHDIAAKVVDFRGLYKNAGV